MTGNQNYQSGPNGQYSQPDAVDPVTGIAYWKDNSSGRFYALDPQTGQPYWYTPHSNPSSPSPRPPKQKSYKWMLIVALLLLVALVLGGTLVGVLYYKHQSEQSESKSSQSKFANHKVESDKKSQTPEDSKHSDVAPADAKAIRDFDFANAVWPVWSRTTSHDSRFSDSAALSDGVYTSSDGTVHCFKMEDNAGKVFKDLNGDGYEDAAIVYAGTRNEDCQMGDKAWRYVIVWVWDPASDTAHYLPEPAMDVRYELTSSGVRLQAVEQGVLVEFGGGGMGYSQTFKVVDDFIVSADPKSDGGWGGTCVPTSTEQVGPFSSVTVSPRPGAPQAKGWKQAKDFNPASVNPGSPEQSSDDGRVLVSYESAEGRIVCGWAN